jgi:Lrp/AsnC family transcriptional regulator for asnA, asnC and gidA
MQIEEKDRKILIELAENGRAQLTRVAKKARLSREVTGYRVQRLEENGTIRGYSARVNLERTGKTLFVLLMKTGMTKADQFSRLKNIKNIHWVAALSGEHDLFVAFSVSSPRELPDTLQQITTIANAKTYSLNTFIAEYKDDFRTYFAQAIPPYHTSFKALKSEPRIDELDESIIILLAKNARTTNREISKKLKISEENARYRIKNLEKEGTILGYRTLIDPNKLGFTSFYLLLQFNGMTPETHKKVQSLLPSNPRIVYMSQLVGNHDYLVECFFTDLNEYGALIQEIKNQFPELRVISSNLLLKVEHSSHI